MSTNFCYFMEVYGLLIPVLKKRVWFWILLAFFPKREGVCYCSIWDLWTLALLFIENNIVVFPILMSLLWVECAFHVRNESLKIRAIISKATFWLLRKRETIRFIIQCSRRIAFLFNFISFFFLVKLSNEK